MRVLNRSSFGAARAETVRDGGSAAARACRTVLRETRCALASARIDDPFTRASRRILANNSTLNSITAFHRRKNNPDEINGGVGSSQTAIISRRAVRWVPNRLRKRYQLKLP